MQIVKPHRKKSREATEADIPRIKELAKGMAELCNKRHGNYPGAYAIAHCQVEEKDPIRFFVLREGNVFINPRILDHTKATVDSKEGCMSYADKPQKVVQRHNKIKVVIEVVGKGEQILELNGRIAKIFQHEIDHFEGKYIYD